MPAHYRIGVIGATGRGNYGHQVDTAWLQVPQTTVVAVADADPAGRESAVQRLRLKTGYADWREMLERERPDIVSICSRWIDQHAEMILEAARRGMHVYLEKPFCRTPREADQIIAACEPRHLKIAIAHPTRHSPLLDTTRRLIAGGAIGRVLELRGRGKEDRRGGGEDLWVLGTHLMDLVLALGYEPEWCQARVTENGQPLRREHVKDGNEGIGPLAGDAIHAVYGLKGGVPFTFDSVRDMQGRPSRYGLQIFGSKGVIEILEGPLAPVTILRDPSWSPGRSGKRWETVSSAGIGVPEPLKDPKYAERHQLAIEDLLAAIADGREPKCGMYEGRKITEMLLAPFESQRVGGPVTFPLQTRVNPLTLL